MLQHHIDGTLGDHGWSRQVYRDDAIPETTLQITRRIEPVHYPAIVHDVVHLAEPLLGLREHVVECSVIGHIDLEHKSAFRIRGRNLLREVFDELVVHIAHNYLGTFLKELLGDRAPKAAASSSNKGCLVGVNYHGAMLFFVAFKMRPNSLSGQMFFT